MSNLTPSELKHCIQLCWDCRDTCQSTLFKYCLKEGGHHLEEGHAKLMADCIQICQASADFMTRNSAMHASVCAACADVCEACAKSCEAMDDDVMKACADACRKCAAECGKMGRMKKAA